MSARTGLMFGTAKPVPVKVPRNRAATCAASCPECGSENFQTWPYNFGTERETGYEDSGVRALCRDCGHDADIEDFAVSAA
jgi:hypothetical protein